MVDLVVSLLAVYGLAFFFQNKMARPKKMHWIFEKLLSCIYCLGFWSALLVSAARIAVCGSEGEPIEVLFDVFLFGFASAAFCYVLDTAARWLEDK
jgi:hypothetical protein